MIEIMYYKNGAIIIKLNAAVSNLNVRGILMSLCGRDEHGTHTLHWSSKGTILLVHVLSRYVSRG
jgi:hypothetical protein